MAQMYAPTICCRSEMKPSSSIEFEWEIRDCSKLIYNEIYSSPEFKMSEDNVWGLQYSNISNYSLGYQQYDRKISLIWHGCENPTLEISFKLYFSDAINIRSTGHKMNECKKSSVITYISKKISDPLIDDSLTVKCEIQVVQFAHSQYPTTSSPVTNVSVGRILFDKRLTSGDVTLVANGRRFKAHKLILSTQSPVFTAMFRSDTKEWQTNQVNIPDIEPQVLEEFLRYVYTGEVAELATLAADLLVAADKYDVPPLKEVCLGHLVENLSVENAAEMLVLADRHSAEDSKTSVIDFINKNKERVIKTAEWKELMKPNCRLMAELY